MDLIDEPLSDNTIGPAAFVGPIETNPDAAHPDPDPNVDCYCYMEILNVTGGSSIETNVWDLRDHANFGQYFWFNGANLDSWTFYPSNPQETGTTFPTPSKELNPPSNGNHTISLRHYFLSDPNPSGFSDFTIHTMVNCWLRHASGSTLETTTYHNFKKSEGLPWINPPGSNAVWYLFNREFSCLVLPPQNP
jgi:hypothetical protein